MRAWHCRSGRRRSFRLPARPTIPGRAWHGRSAPVRTWYDRSWLPSGRRRSFRLPARPTIPGRAWHGRSGAGPYLVRSVVAAFVLCRGGWCNFPGWLSCRLRLATVVSRGVLDSDWSGAGPFSLVSRQPDNCRRGLAMIGNSSIPFSLFCHPSGERRDVLPVLMPRVLCGQPLAARLASSTSIMAAASSSRRRTSGRARGLTSCTRAPNPRQQL